VFQQAEHSEELLANRDLRSVARDLESICQSTGIVAVHYTRGVPERLAQEGLVPRTGAERRAELIEEYGHRFTREQRDRLIAGWRDYFDEQQNEARDGRIWFNLTQKALFDGGATSLLQHFGGEVIHMPFHRDTEIARILSSIGEPLIVRCRVATRAVTTFCELPWGRTWLSSYHCAVASGAHQWDVDLYQEAHVAPSEIVDIQRVALT
jgi:hypothetical protein